MREAKQSLKIKWDEQQRESPGVQEDLPSSEDKSFWGPDAEQQFHADSDTIRPLMQSHILKQKGNQVICIGCPHEHSVPVDLKKYEVKDGTLVKRT